VPALDGGELFIACGAPPREVAERVRPNADLLGDVIEHNRRQHLAALEMAARITQRAELERVAEPGLGRARLGNRSEIIGIEAVVTDHLLFGSRQREERLALPCGHWHTRRHGPTPSKTPCLTLSR
jgi:hypothetical protein